MNNTQIKTLLQQTENKLQQLKKEAIKTKQQLEEHIREFDAHSEPIRLPNWMKKKG